MKKLFIKSSSILLLIYLFIGVSLNCYAASDDEIILKKNNINTYFSSLSVPSVGSVGGEWLIISAAQDDNIQDDYAQGYYANALSYVKNIGSSKLDKNKSTDNSRLILALSSIGKDVTNIGGYNLLEPLSDFNYLKKQGTNGVIWALIALDSKNYEILIDENAEEPVTRKKLIDYLIDSQLSDGGWDLINEKSTAELTAMAVQALSPYYTSDASVKDSLDKAIDYLSDNQQQDGSFLTGTQPTSESCAQVIIALTSLGINPSEDERFIKNNDSVLDALMSFSVENGFSHIQNGTYNQLSTEQSYLALTAYSRLISGKKALYDMSEVRMDVAPDLNEDGTLSILDATLLQKHLAGILYLSEELVENADFNYDDCVNIKDVTKMQKYYAGLV